MLTDADVRERCAELLSREDVDKTDRISLRGAQFDMGLAWVHFPLGRGGLGLTRDRQVVIDAMLVAAGVDFDGLLLNPIGIGMAAPTLIAYAPPETQARHLRAIFTAEEKWCQLFSEPSSGSDLAGLRTRAVAVPGGGWIVNGQKVWTSLAQDADYALLMARTDPEVPKHQGLTYFVLDMKTPGVEVRPLAQLTGETEFCEVFLTDVAVAPDAVLGELGDGWRVATTTLMSERAALGGKGASALLGPLLRQWTRSADALDDLAAAVARDRVMSLWVRGALLDLTSQRLGRSSVGSKSGPISSVAKLMWAELSQAAASLSLSLQGAAGTVEPGSPTADDDRPATRRYLRSRANTIEGGTSEVMRNILAERVLGLPGDIRPDKGIAWKDIPH